MDKKEYEKQIRRIEKYQELKNKLDLLTKLSNVKNDIKEAYIVLNNKGGLLHIPIELYANLSQFLEKQAKDYIPFIEDEMKQI